MTILYSLLTLFCNIHHTSSYMFVPASRLFGTFRAFLPFNLGSFLENRTCLNLIQLLTFSLFSSCSRLLTLAQAATSKLIKYLCLQLTAAPSQLSQCVQGNEGTSAG